MPCIRPAAARVTAVLGLSLAVHVGGGWLLLAGGAPTPAAAGDPGIRVVLGGAAAGPAAVAAIAAAAPASVNTAQAVVPSPVDAAAVEMAAPAVAVDMPSRDSAPQSPAAAVEAVPAETVSDTVPMVLPETVESAEIAAVSEPVAMTADAVPQRRPEPPAEPEPAVAPEPSFAALADAAKLAAADAGTGEADKAAAPAGEAQVASLGGNVSPGAATSGDMPASPAFGAGGVADDFLLRLQAWLERHKRYPRRARMRHLEGVALVRFVLDHEGGVSAVELANSSGHALLDAEATELLYRAQPLPRATRSGTDRTLLLEVPIRFSLR